MDKETATQIFRDTVYPEFKERVLAVRPKLLSYEVNHMRANIAKKVLADLENMTEEKIMEIMREEFRYKSYLRSSPFSESFKMKAEAKAREKLVDPSQFPAIYQEANQAGIDAVSKLEVIPMIVSEADPISGRPTHGGKSWFVADGVCGFAWVSIRPGNCPFANWLKKSGKARTDSYSGGVQIWISDYNQSMQKKETYAAAFAAVIREKLGIHCYSGSRMD